MGKRGGGRRKRATQWEAGQQSNGNDEEGSSRSEKRSKVMETPANSTDTSDKDIVEASLIGNSTENNCFESLPAPLDIEGDSSQEKPHVEAVRNIWNYLGKDKQMTTWSPTPIQRQLWSILLESSWNAIGVAPTGSGKTLAYSVPTIVSIVMSGSSLLVLVPTRELVQQIAKVSSKVVKAATKKMNKSVEMQVVSIYGGIPRSEQRQQINEATNNGASKQLIVVATPGRLLDLLKDTKFPIMDWIILDEADQLANSGDLGPQVDDILKGTRSDASRLVLVSATYPEKSKTKFQEWVGPHHALVQVDHLQHQAAPYQPKKKSNIDTDGDADAGNDLAEEEPLPVNKNSGTFARIPAHLEQVLHVCSEHKKPKKLLHTLQTNYSKHNQKRSLPLGIIFFAKIEKLQYISKLLDKDGISNVQLHSQLATTKLREQNLSQFACGQTPLLLATDVAARGIDIPSIQFVIQYDFPGNLQQYVHRCGRAGRSDSSQKATIYSFFTRNMKPMAADLIQLLEANSAWVDPNLRLLADGSERRGKAKRGKIKAPKPAESAKSIAENDNEEAIDDFPELAANRIVLKRASHVSYTSSSEEEE